MAEENVEIVRRIYDAVARGDNATVLAAYDAEVEFDFFRSPFREMLDHPVFRRRGGSPQLYPRAV